MNQIDALLLVLLAPFAVRGYFRGFCRESFGLVGLVGGAFVAAAGASRLAVALVARGPLSESWARPAALVLLFAGTVIVANLLGRLADRVVRAILLGPLNRAAGVAFGAVKGATLLGFGLLVAQRLIPQPAFAELLSASRLGRPLERLANTVLETGRAVTATTAESHA